MALVLGLVLGLGPASASDPLRLQQGFRFLDLGQYTRTKADERLEFSIQNGSSAPLALMIVDYPPSDLTRAFGLRDADGQALRLFASDDSEFAALPGFGQRLDFVVPAGAVMTYYLSGGTSERLYLWSPQALDAFENRQSTMRLTVLLVLLVLLGLGGFVAVQRRSRRAAYALVMGLGLILLLVSLWAQALAAGSWLETQISPNRLLIIRSALAFWLLMQALGHLNLIIRVVLHRNYWTRVVIISDLCVLATFCLWLTSLFWLPNFAGVTSNDLIEMVLSLACASVLLGAVFVPDRREARQPA